MHRTHPTFILSRQATSPVFAVFVSTVLLGERFSKRVLVSLVPIVCGVVLCTVTELNFDTIGFLCAFGSTITFVLQNTYSKKSVPLISCGVVSVWCILLLSV
jgi:drug/metabolite transporter (DMT)-like permease